MRFQGDKTFNEPDLAHAFLLSYAVCLTYL